jgi:hypothetical protein
MLLDFLIDHGQRRYLPSTHRLPVSVTASRWITLRTAPMTPLGLYSHDSGRGEIGVRRLAGSDFWVEIVFWVVVAACIVGAAYVLPQQSCNPEYEAACSSD